MVEVFNIRRILIPNSLELKLPSPLLAVLLTFLIVTGCSNKKPDREKEATPLFSQNLQSQRTNHHQRIQGSNVFLVIPEGFKSQFLPSFEAEGPQIAVYQKDSFTRFYLYEEDNPGIGYPEALEYFNSMKERLQEFETTQVDRFSAFYYSGVEFGEKVQSLFWGNDGFMVKISCYSRPEDTQQHEAFLKMFENLHFDYVGPARHLELFEFEFDYESFDMAKKSTRKGHHFTSRNQSFEMYVAVKEPLAEHTWETFPEGDPLNLSQVSNKGYKAKGEIEKLVLNGHPALSQKIANEAEDKSGWKVILFHKDLTLKLYFYCDEKEPEKQQFFSKILEAIRIREDLPQPYWHYPEIPAVSSLKSLDMTETPETWPNSSNMGLQKVSCFLVPLGV